MIDICIVLHRNYDLLDMQLKHWNWIAGEHRLLFCDNTPKEVKKDLSGYDINLYHNEVAGSDGESHGATLDFLVCQTKSEIIGICDSDFFWTDRNILSQVEQLFSNGCKCCGAELWYDDFEKVNQIYPDRAGYLAPCVFGMFIDRELALSETFVCTTLEGFTFRETGWRIRKKIIKEKIPCCVWRKFQLENQPDPKVVFFGSPDERKGLHFLKGSNKMGRNAKLLFESFGLEKLYV